MVYNQKLTNANIKKEETIGDKSIFMLESHISDMTLSTEKQCHHMSPVARKLVFGVSDQVRHKPGCAITEYS